LKKKNIICLILYNVILTNRNLTVINSQPNFRPIANWVEIHTSINESLHKSHKNMYNMYMYCKRFMTKVTLKIEEIYKLIRINIYCLTKTQHIVIDLC